ncbi:hypothetical protein V8B97DRAFT_1874661 [Scleroderma yunnanense]
MNSFLSQLHYSYQTFLNDCPSGKADKAYFIQLHRSMYPSGDPDEFAEYLFAVFDRNRDGFIDFNDHISVLSTMMKGSFEDKYKWIFYMYDIDKDGFITYAEMSRIFIAIDKLTCRVIKSSWIQESPEMRVNRMFAKMDRNKDNKLSLDEFLAGCRSDPAMVVVS